MLFSHSFNPHFSVNIVRRRLCTVHQAEATPLRLIKVEVAILMPINNELHGLALTVALTHLIAIPLLLDRSGIGDAHLVDLRIEWLVAHLGLLQVFLESTLLLVHVLLVLKCLFVQNFVLLLLGLKTLGEASIIGDLGSNLILSVGGTNQLVRNFDFVGSALLQKFQVLAVANHTLLALLEALPLFVFNHGGVRVHVLPLKFNFLELLG